ncbi:hypothetical protein P170DRAFT_441919 [Aspergillus steynii IBT 23096]|uniref:Pyruvate carboxylase n=1 Tax=Aspergillus steynii IBT 23096 TaxID=1392250 RepID=A0A2I2GL72_9EURO|nr:uncharacterized protein P170DRAFT_441919 [Aspergillus steynii IBT 23096]PLB53632.1 hypothetical protein P170DRAFT_441919 [Aspergillus steynii IBT 23096]
MTDQPIRRLLIANRGEIAVRIIQAAREFSPSIETFALYTEDDRSHCDIAHPHHLLPLPSPAAYSDVSLLVGLARKHDIDTVHPGYGFLSESADFASRPGAAILRRTGDKLQAKQLAVQCSVPVLPAIPNATSDMAEIQAFAHQVHYPVMIKAVDGGGGRGIRLVRQEHELENAIRAATNESPSETVFVEKAAVDGFHHIEVQVIGDGTDARHLWERDCSVQRRFQKSVEIAPSLIPNRGLLQQVIDAALRMAKTIGYRSLGTVEFLVHERRSEFYFLEINPRLQVEHTVTEAITGFDLVQAQFQLAQGRSLSQIGLGGNPAVPKHGHSIQLRLCAEDPRRGFSLSMGKITEFLVPTGHGVRLDTHVGTTGSSAVVVGAQFDNLLAKIIVAAFSWEAAVSKARRVLTDTRVSGVQTNLDLLRGVVEHEDFLGGSTDTQWLERQLHPALQLGENISQAISHGVSQPSSRTTAPPTLPSSSLLFRRGDAWSLALEPLNTVAEPREQHHLQLTRVLQNDFPASMAAEVEYTTPSSKATYRLQLKTTSTATAALVSSSHRRGDTDNPRQIVLPLSGKLIEVLVEPGQMIAENQVVAFVRQMKMELEVRSPRTGRARWVYEMEEEEDRLLRLCVKFYKLPKMKDTLSLYILTFNCARNPVDVDRFAPHFFDALPTTDDASSLSPPDLIVLSLQEVAPIAYAFLGGSFLTPYLSAFSRLVDRAVARHWACHYVTVATENVGMTGLLVFARSDVADDVASVDTAGVGLGVQQMGNKGAVGARLAVAMPNASDHTADLTFIAAHLAPMEDAIYGEDDVLPRVISRRIRDPEDLLTRQEDSARLAHNYSRPFSRSSSVRTIVGVPKEQTGSTIVSSPSSIPILQKPSGGTPEKAFSPVRGRKRDNNPTSAPMQLRPSNRIWYSVSPTPKRDASEFQQRMAVGGMYDRYQVKRSPVPHDSKTLYVRSARGRRDGGRVTNENLKAEQEQSDFKDSLRQPPSMGSPISSKRMVELFLNSRRQQMGTGMSDDDTTSEGAFI